MKILWLLFWEFFQTGLFSIGGGLATLPFLHSIAERYDWYTVSELSNMIAISESTPGPIGVNMATYAGYQAYGVLGSVVATLSLVLPSVIIIILVSQALTRFQKSRLVQHAFYGIQPATAGLIAGAAFPIFQLSLLDSSALGTFGLFRFGAIFLFFALFVLIKKLPKIHPIAIILIGAAAGLIFKM